MTSRRAVIVGAGQMGTGIAQVLATAGHAVALCDVDAARAAAAWDAIAAALERAVARGRLEPPARAAALARIATAGDLAPAARATLVVEAVPEDEALKRRVWTELGRLAPAGALLATNTSSISVDRLAGALPPGRRAAFAGLHFFNPVPAMPIVELVRGAATSEATVAALRALATELGKEVVLAADRPGFIVNRVLFALLAEAMRALEDGVGTAEAIDAAARLGLGHPMGPLELADLIGLDTCLAILRVLHEELDGAGHAPPAILERLVAEGRLGRKTGEGFHRHGA